MWPQSHTSSSNPSQEERLAHTHTHPHTPTHTHTHTPTHTHTHTEYTFHLQMYISECIGVEFVGISVILWGTFAGLGSFSVGWLVRYVAAYVMVVFTIGLGQMGAIVFLITWVRQPSLTAVTIMSAISGVCYGVGSASSLGKLMGMYPHSLQEIQHLRMLH